MNLRKVDKSFPSKLLTQFKKMSKGVDYTSDLHVSDYTNICKELNECSAELYGQSDSFSLVPLLQGQMYEHISLVSCNMATPTLSLATASKRRLSFNFQYQSLAFCRENEARNSLNIIRMMP